MTHWHPARAASSQPRFLSLLDPAQEHNVKEWVQEPRSSRVWIIFFFIKKKGADSAVEALIFAPRFFNTFPIPEEDRPVSPAPRSASRESLHVYDVSSTCLNAHFVLLPAEKHAPQLGISTAEPSMCGMA